MIYTCIKGCPEAAPGVLCVAEITIPREELGDAQIAVYKAVGEINPEDGVLVGFATIALSGVERAIRECWSHRSRGFNGLVFRGDSVTLGAIAMHLDTARVSAEATGAGHAGRHQVHVMTPDQYQGYAGQPTRYFDMVHIDVSPDMHPPTVMPPNASQLDLRTGQWLVPGSTAWQLDG